MLKLNKVDNSDKGKVRKHCANYDTGFNCIGVIIGGKLQQRVDSELEGKPCLVADGKECNYYNRCVKPIADKI